MSMDERLSKEREAQAADRLVRALKDRIASYIPPKPMFSAAPGEYAKECGFNPGMIDPPKPGTYTDVEPVKQQEDAIAAFFKAEDDELDLRCWKFLRMRHSHWASDLTWIDREIAAVRKKKEQSK